MGEKKKPNLLRRKFLIYPRFQLTLIVVNALLIIAAFGLAHLEAERTFTRFYEIGKSINLDTTHPYFKLIEFQANSLHARLTLVFLAAILLASLATLLVSHRLAGPIVRLRKYLRDIASKKAVSAPLAFRKGDFFEDLPDAVNDAFKALK